MVATDFFTMEMWTRHRLQPSMVLFFMELSTHGRSRLLLPRMELEAC